MGFHIGISPMSNRQIPECVSSDVLLGDHYSTSFSSISFNHCFRSCNTVADALAAISYNSSDNACLYWEVVPRLAVSLV